MELMTKTSVFPIDILEFPLSIWISNFILEMAKTISQKLELFPLNAPIQYSQNRFGTIQLVENSTETNLLPFEL